MDALGNLCSRLNLGRIELRPPRESLVDVHDGPTKPFHLPLYDFSRDTRNHHEAELPLNMIAILFITHNAPDSPGNPSNRIVDSLCKGPHWVTSVEMDTCPGKSRCGSISC